LSLPKNEDIVGSQARPGYQIDSDGVFAVHGVATRSESTARLLKLETCACGDMSEGNPVVNVLKTTFFVEWE